MCHNPLISLRLLLAGAVLVPAAALAQGMPEPTGPHAIGTVTLRLVDSSRSDARTGNRFGGRPITAQFWYPARPGGTGVAPYVVEPGLVDSMIARGYFDDTAALAAMRTMRTHALTGAPLAGTRLPLVTISHGLGIARMHMTTIAEDLASHGYVAVTIDHPHGGFMLLPDGAVASTADDSAGWNSEAFHEHQMDEWAMDIRFVLARLRAARTGPLELVSHGVDWTRVAAIGQSSGGLAALEACNTDPDLRACVDMDGGFMSPAGVPIVAFPRTGAKRATLLLRSDPIYSDSDLARRGRTRAQWDAGRSRMLAVFEDIAGKSNAPIIEVRVAGTGHMSFTDAPFVMPSMITRFGGQVIDPARGYLVMTEVVRSWLANQLGLPGPRFEAVTASFPELRVLTLRAH